MRIWRGTFLEHRKHNPIVFKAANNVVIPYFARIMGFYYGWTRSEQLRQAFWTLSVVRVR